LHDYLWDKISNIYLWTYSSLQPYKEMPKLQEENIQNSLKNFEGLSFNF